MNCTKIKFSIFHSPFSIFLYLCKMRATFFLKILLWCVISMDLPAQSFFFEKQFDITVKDTAGNLIKQPWIGGLNACIMGEIDLNFDEKNDLVVYDQHAGKIFTFLNFSENGSRDYRYTPQYEVYFPNITKWFQLLDFNGDGLRDLFVFDGISGISLYKNVSQDLTLKFELYIPKLKAKIFDTYENLFCSSVDFPAFADVDGDGDLDLLNFWVPSAANTLYYYKNHSKEKYGRADSLDFVLEDSQWGCFEENGESNQILLDICNNKGKVSLPSKAPNRPIPKHTGSTVFSMDLNNDLLQDLLLADFGYPNMVALYNGGTHERAKITNVDTLFPKQSTPVYVLNCPAISAIDMDNDGVKELIFSPFSGLDFSTESYASNWVYKNMSTSATADYQLISKRFLQDEMLDFGMGAYPTVVDIDGDGLLDIVVGNYGIIDSAWEELGAWKSRFSSDLTLLRNIGTSNEPQFQISQLTLTPKLNVSGAVPAFGDIDNDGKLELLIGTESGEIRLYKQVGVKFELTNANILSDNIGKYLAPQLFDLNNDGLLDLIVGDQRATWRDVQNRLYFKGNINYLQNTGTRESPEFMLITDSLGSIDVCNRERSNFGYSKPCFFRDTIGNTHLFCGNEDGKVLHYNNIDDNLQGIFDRLDDITYALNDRAAVLSEGSHTAVAIADFNNDGILDMVVGNHRGGLTFFYGTLNPPTKNETPVNTAKIVIYPNPAHDWLFIQTDETNSIKCEILDVQGRIILPLQSVKNGQSLDIRAFPTGIYLIKFVVKNRIYSQKFIKN